MGRPPTIANNETPAVPSLCVLVPHTLLRGKDPQSNRDPIDKRVQQQVSARNDRETATAPAYDLVLAVRRRRLRYLGHVLRMPADRMVRCALMALVSDSVMYPTGSLFSDCQGVALAMAANRAMPTCGNGGESCNVARQSGVAVVNLRCFKVISCTTKLYHRTLGVYNEKWNRQGFRAEMPL